MSGLRQAAAMTGRIRRGHIMVQSDAPGGVADVRWIIGDLRRSELEVEFNWRAHTPGDPTSTV